jgi:probable rRNA maturation factor
MPDGFPALDSSRRGFELSLANEQSVHMVDEPRLLAAARRVLEDSDYPSATISLAVVDDPTIHRLNRQFLEHNWATDVLSFTLEDHHGHLDGEIVLSADTAAAAAEQYGTSAAAEQLLYVVHGMLHLVGYDDTSVADAERMRIAERHYLRSAGIELPEDRAQPRPVHASGGDVR